ncbi:MAG: FMN-binding protein [Deltaproteobacteria bacterium]|nr:FMN-binding protein [Deltaproteobacteria bacterium]MBW1918661.1 FMN-binding protein [Deltaproteobacteria bacterium]MBW1934682.1 FMN-binding protein [Deltaproteobacteria bacterium]MBW1976944.1 FMN-binding protein [Deltaproteobacteria bacterium]MBW2043528.1 FMN-binding protein [Deltaproteobacteria bacterium]
MREILRITIGLTVSCLIAALVMGAVFTITDKAKKHNEYMNVQQTMLGLLGYSKSHPAPSELKFETIYRYIVAEGQTRYLGYLVPVKKNGKENYAFLLLDLEGKLKKLYSVDMRPEAAIEASEREKALHEILKPPRKFNYADSFIIAVLGRQRVAYLIPGEFPGFKTFVRVMLALDPSFTIKGLEIMEQEEDPGLGGEIVQEYFKNQFVDKPFKKIASLKVIKKPLPSEYRKYLERKKWKKGMFTREQIEEIRKKYRSADIYALTGATISSRAVTNGVKNMVKKFAYREKMLERVIAEENIQAAF